MPEPLEAMPQDGSSETINEPLLAFSHGRLSRGEAIRQLGLRDYAELLVKLGDADLPMPLPPAQDIENQALLFAKLWKQG
jgi:hypothetical protein